jgi:hypothetical protein
MSVMIAADHRRAVMGTTDVSTAMFLVCRRLTETSIPDDAGSTFAFSEGWREHSRLCDRRPDTLGGRQESVV